MNDVRSRGVVAQISSPPRAAHEGVYSSLVAAMDRAFCLIQVLFDGDGPDARPVDYRYIEVNAAYARQSALKDVVGRTSREVAPNVELHWIESYGRVVRTGEPVRIEATSQAAGGRWFSVEAFRVGDPNAALVACGRHVGEKNSDERRRTRSSLG